MRTGSGQLQNCREKVNAKSQCPLVAGTGKKMEARCSMPNGTGQSTGKAQLKRDATLLAKRFTSGFTLCLVTAQGFTLCLLTSQVLTLLKCSLCSSAQIIPC